MTVASPTRAWTPRIAVQLTVLAAAAFVYVTAEIVPVGALPAIAVDLDVSEALVGTLLASYALVAAVTTVPLVRLTAHWPRRRTLVLTLVCLTASQLISALAPNFTVLAGGRVLCALTHGLMWSVIAPIGVRLVPASHAGRATTAVYVGTSLALVVGNPLTAAMSELWGWRLAVVVVTVAAAAVTVAAWAALPPMVMSDDEVETIRRHERHHRNGRLVTLSVLTLVGVTGHFISYTFIVVIIRDVLGVHGAPLAWLLAAFGVAGLVSMGVMARPLDKWPKASVVGCLGALAAAFAVLATLAFDHRAGLLTLVDWHRRDRAVGCGVDRAAPDAAGRGHAKRARRPRRRLRPLCHRVSGRHNGRLAVRRGAVRERRIGRDDRGVGCTDTHRAGLRRRHEWPVLSSLGN